MSDPSNTPSPPPTGDWREQRRAERRASRVARWGGAPLGGIVLVLLGLLLLAQNSGYPLPERWWAFFLLIPAAVALVAAWRQYQEHGNQMTAEVLSSLLSGAIFLLLFGAFFLGFDWGVFGPAILIIIGLGILARDYWPTAGPKA